MIGNSATPPETGSTTTHDHFFSPTPTAPDCRQLRATTPIALGCEMPHYDSPPLLNSFFAGRRSQETPSQPPTTDRHEIIRRIKNGHIIQDPDKKEAISQDPYDNALGIGFVPPRSALHRGDFHQQAQAQQAPSTSPVVPWQQPSQLLQRPRAASQASLSGSFSYQPPTSPLVHQANAADMPDHPVQHDTPTRNLHSHIHRHHSLRNFPYQAHQPRRSIGSIGSQSQSPFPSARRPSISDASPLQHAPMVGSYEESILRGRMSTTPSKPLDFVAQIGVLGKGDCKPSLKCPPHIAVPFPAVFYSYASGTTTDPEPSPYVGMVDLENALKKPDDSDNTQKRRRKHQDHATPSTPLLTDSPDDEKVRKRRQQKLNKRTSTTSKSAAAAPPGAYRIPPTGQLQIVIKNPNKTAVKLFLVPYDFVDMQPGTKTFIRQRSYSPASATEKPVLRYLIHLHICCPAKGKVYLYRDVRVVFANRVPDGSEKLKTEMQMPEPRYSAYKPCDPIATAVDVAARRRKSAVFPLQQLQQQHSFGQWQGGSLDSLDRFSFASAAGLETLESRPGSRGDVDMCGEEAPDHAFTFEREEMGRQGVRPAESLLSRRLRDLEVRGRQD